MSRRRQDPTAGTVWAGSPARLVCLAHFAGQRAEVEDEGPDPQRELVRLGPIPEDRCSLRTTFLSLRRRSGLRELYDLGRQDPPRDSQWLACILNITRYTPPRKRKKAP